MCSQSIYKLFSLSVIYRMRFADLLALYGLDLEKVNEFPQESCARDG